jgi:uncharacterized protein involved in exopolysaccharide biosynthesis
MSSHTRTHSETPSRSRFPGDSAPQVPEAGPDADPSDPIALSLRELVQRIAAARRLIPVGAAFGLVVAVAAWVVMPRVYVSETTILPSSGEESSSLPGGLLSVAGSLGIRLPGASVPESHLFPAILKSERIVRHVLAAPVDPGDPARGAVYDHVADPGKSEPVRTEAAIARVRQEILRVGLDEETNIVRIIVAMHDPVLANRVADVFVAELESYLMEERNARSRHNLEFVTQRRDEASAELAQAEARLRDFRDRNRRIANSPDLLLQEGRLIRDVRVQEEVFLELTRQMELAGIEAEKATPILEILDPPTLRHVPRSPKLPILVGVGVLAGILLGTLAAAAMDSPRLNPGALLASVRLLWGGRA